LAYLEAKTTILARLSWSEDHDFLSCDEPQTQTTVEMKRNRHRQRQNKDNSQGYSRFLHCGGKYAAFGRNDSSCSSKFKAS
jgi:hypothetical protein